MGKPKFSVYMTNLDFWSTIDLPEEAVWASSGKSATAYLEQNRELAVLSYKLKDAPENTWKTKTFENFKAEPLQVEIFKNGKQVYELPPLRLIRDRCRASLETMWEEVKRFDNPHNYYVDLSKKLWDIKYGMIKEQRHKK